MPNPFVVVNLFCKKKRSFFSAPLPGPVPGPPGEARAQLVDQDGVGHARARPARALEGERAKGAAGALVGEGQEGSGAREGDHHMFSRTRRASIRLVQWMDWPVPVAVKGPSRNQSRRVPPACRPPSMR